MPFDQEVCACGCESPLMTGHIRSCATCPGRAKKKLAFLCEQAGKTCKRCQVKVAFHDQDDSSVESNAAVVAGTTAANPSATTPAQPQTNGAGQATVAVHGQDANSAAPNAAEVADTTAANPSATNPAHIPTQSS